MTAIEALVSGYAEDLARGRRVSPRTRQAYLRDLRALCRQVGDLDPRSLTSLQIRAFVADERLAGRAPVSLARMLSAWRSFFGYALREGLVPHNPADGVRAPRRPKLLPKALAPEEASALLDADPQTDTAIRDLAMFELMYSSALRVGELVAVQCADIDEAEGMMLVRKGKGGKERSVPLGRAALGALAAWSEVRAQWLGGRSSPHLFVSRRGGPLTERSVQLRIKGWCAKAGLSRDVTPHQLRHSCATHLLQSSGDIRQVQEMLGHERIATTQIYTHLDFQALAKVYDSTHPRAKGKKPRGAPGSSG